MPALLARGAPTPHAVHKGKDRQTEAHRCRSNAGPGRHPFSSKTSGLPSILDPLKLSGRPAGIARHISDQVHASGYISIVLYPDPTRNQLNYPPTLFEPRGGSAACLGRKICMSTQRELHFTVLSIDLVQDAQHMHCSQLLL